MFSPLPGVHTFHNEVFPQRREHFEQLANGQKPSTLFITCSDSRIVPELLTQTEPGELFVLRNAGNLVPPYDADFSGAAATVEYAVKALGVEQIVVCGHSHCGAVTGVLRPELIEGLPAVEKWLKVAEAEADGRLSLFGWFYRFETGQVFQFDDQEQQFVNVIEGVDEPGVVV
jgi:carbonic anhydrase